MPTDGAQEWRGIPPRGKVTNEVSWDRYFLFLCPLTMVSQSWRHNNEVKAAWAASGSMEEAWWPRLTLWIASALQSSSNGVTLGTPNKATITILSNDNAFGIIAFNSVRKSEIVHYLHFICCLPLYSFWTEIGNVLLNCTQPQWPQIVPANS